MNIALVTVCTLTLAVASSHAAVEFVGYVTAGTEVKFMLADPEKGKKSDWLARGGVFDGYTIIAFDAKKGQLSVERAGTILQLLLKPARVQQMAKTPAHLGDKARDSAEEIRRLEAELEALKASDAKAGARQQSRP